MGISAQDFRIRIGNFHSSNMKFNLKIKKKPSLSNKKTFSTIAVCLTLVLVLNFLFCQTFPHGNEPVFVKKYSRNLNKNIVKTSDIQNSIKSSLFYWSQSGLSINKIQKIINGNRRIIGYKLAVWNCSRGLIQDDFSSKLVEIKQFINTRKPHCFGIIESGLFSHDSQVNRHRKYSSTEIREKLKIDGYNIEFPSSWYTHGQARLICYVSDEIKYRRKHLNDGLDHIPSITLEVGLGKATKTTVHYYYREWTNGVTGESDNASQLVQLQQHVGQWEALVRSGRKFI